MEAESARVNVLDVKQLSEGFLTFLGQNQQYLSSNRMREDDEYF